MSYLKNVRRRKKTKITPRNHISDDAQLKDHVFKQYCKRADRFLDLFNYFIYNGEQVLTEDKVQLVDRDASEIFVERGKDGKFVSLGKLRDIFTSVAFKQDLESDTHYLFLAIEEQSWVDYTLPTRVMLYDALAYSHQIKLAKSARESAKSKRKTAKLKKAEIVFDKQIAASKPHQLTPVITLVVYLGKRPWTGPRDLYDMMPGISDAIKRVVPNYPLNLIEAINLAPNQIAKFKTKWGAVFEAFQKYVKEGARGLVNYVEASDSLKSSSCNDDLQLIECMTGTLLPIPEEQRSDTMKMSQDMIDYLDEIKQEAAEKAAEKAAQAERQKSDARLKESAKRMLQKGLSAELISECIDLSIEEITQLTAQPVV